MSRWLARCCSPVAAYAVLALVVVGWGWLLTHSLQGSIEGTDDDVSRWFAGQRTSSARSGRRRRARCWVRRRSAWPSGQSWPWWRGWRCVACAAVLLVALANAGDGGIYWLGSHAGPARSTARCASSTPGLVPDHSFPSGHVGTAVAVYGGAALLLVLWLRSRDGLGGAGRIVVVVLACVPLFVAVSRLYQGAHHLTDVGTSLVYGTVWLAVLAALLDQGPRSPNLPCHDRPVDTQTRQYRTGDREVVLDLTRDCAAYVADRGDGLLQLFVPHATAGIAIIETGAGSDDDLLSALGDLLPADDRWKHAHGSPGPRAVPRDAGLRAAVRHRAGARRAARARHLAEHLPGRPQRRQRRADRPVLVPGRMIRAYRPDDEAGVRAVVTEAFGDEGETVAALVDDLRVGHARAELVARSRTPRWSGTCC